MAILPMLKVKHSDGFMFVNESDFDPDIHELFEEVPEADPVFVITAKLDEATVYWDGDDFVPEPSDKTYTSEESAEGAIARTKAIQGAIADGVITDVMGIEA